MKRIGATLWVVLLLSTLALPAVGELSEEAKAETLRAGATLVTAGIGLAAGTAIGLGFSTDAIDTPLANTLLLTIPVAAAGTAAGALAGRWIADLALRHQPSPLFSILEGAGLGLVAGAFVGSITFSLNFVLAYPVLDVSEGYWGKFDYPQTVGMSILAGAVWGGTFGALAGAIALPIVSMLMGF